MKKYIYLIFSFIAIRLHIPEIRVVQPGELKVKKDTKVVLTFSNPANTNTKIQFLQAEPCEGESVTAKVYWINILIFVMSLIAYSTQ